jgi:membrane associated rhomboid family serine protease
MKWLDSLERRFHFVAIPQFPLFIATANGLIYLMSQLQPLFVQRLLLDPAAVRAGEWWRVVTFLFVPPMTMNPIFLVFWLLLMYQFSQALENAWGEFRFFFFYFIGAAATVAAAMLITHEPIGNYSTYMTLYLAFATLFPDFELLLFFILPVKVKYLAWFLWFTTGLSFLLGSFAARVAIAASLLNYMLFFGSDIGKALRLKWEVYRNRRRLRP